MLPFKKASVCASLVLVLCGALLTQVQAQKRTLLTRHVRPEVINGQARFVGRLPGDQPMSLALMLPLRNEADLNQTLQNLYDPQSSSYHEFLSVQQFTGRFGPTQEDYDAVIDFAKANGMTVTDTSPNRMVLNVTASVATLETAFNVKMGLYQHPTESRIFFAPDSEPSADLTVQLWHISGLDNFSLPHPLYKKAAVVKANTTGSGPGGSFLGSDRRAAYYGGTSLTGSGQAVALFEFGGYNLNDVQNYFRNVGQSLNVPINNVLLDGAGGGSTGDDTEQVIDIIDAVSMAPSLSQVLVYIAPAIHDTDIFNRMATDNIAKQLSCSWTWKPPDPGSDQPIFREFAAQGQSLFVASGDAGSYPNSSGFYYPAEDPYVTAAGGTDLTTNGPGGSWQSESAWASSGGGPSPDGIGIPSYQQIAGVINASNRGSTTLRNVPDVTAEANTDNYFCANGGCGDALGGTSLAAPTWAGFVALINQQLASNGRPTLGFLNPAIYQVSVGSNYSIFFHDITSGSNGAYSAVTGYDLVTGWGSPVSTGWTETPASASVSPTSLTLEAGQGCTDSNDSVLTNNGPGLLTVRVTVGGNGFSLDTFDSTCTSPLAPGASCQAFVVFTGRRTIGTSSGKLTFIDNASNSPQTVSLTGITKGGGCGAASPSSGPSR